MFLLFVLRNALSILLPLSLISTSYLYLYPAFNPSCAFPSPNEHASTAYLDTLYHHIPFASKNAQNIAPFRLLSLGDPQLEGDTSIPDPEATSFPNLGKFWRDAFGAQHTPLQRLRHSLHDLVDFYLDDIPKAFDVYRKRLDIVGNDYYLGHIYRTLYWWTNPTHVTVLGDLLGSQWIDDEEFTVRGGRYWNRVFRGGLKVLDDDASYPSKDFNRTITLGQDAAMWKRRIINVAGNHDIGYAGDLSQSRIDRFSRVFGKVNYELRFQLPVTSATSATDDEENQAAGDKERPIPELRIIVLNDMNLDTPASSPELQTETYDFLNDVINSSKEVARPAHFTLVLTHIPLYKDAGVCVDGPFFDFFEGEFSDGVKEQNHLSSDASKGFLEGIFGMSGNPNADGRGFGRNGVILNGHDHEGCDIYHYINQTSDEEEEKNWQAVGWSDAVASKINEQPGVPGLREITVRSMMGDFAGNAGFLSLWFDEETWDWKFEFANCRLGKQHFWWFVHVINIISLLVAFVYAILIASLGAIDAAIHAFSAKFAPANKKMGKLKAPESRIDKSGLLKGTIFEVPTRNGGLQIPGAGKESLRRNRSKQNLTSGSE